MTRSALDEALGQQAMSGLSRIDELQTLVELLELDRRKHGHGPAALLLRPLQQDLRAIALTKLEWRPKNQGHWEASSRNGSVYVLQETDDEEDDYRLDFGWRGYGAIGLGTGTKAELERRAQQLAREGGPPGGPVPHDSHPLPWYEWQLVRGTRRRGGAAGELVINGGTRIIHDDDDHGLYCAYRDGTFAVITRGTDRHLVALGDKLAEDDNLQELRPAVTARVGDLTIPFRFLDRALFKGIISTPSGDLLFVDLGKEFYALIYAHGDGNYLPLALRPLELLQRYDVAPVLQAFLGPRVFDEWLTLAKLKPGPKARSGPAPRRDAAVPPATASRAATSAAPASSPVRLPGSPSVRPLPVGVTATASPPPTTARVTEPPRAPAINLEELVLGHLKTFHQRLPTGENGSATARVYLLGIVRAYMSGWSSIEGTWRDVFAPFVESGDLDDMPSDKTARATLNLMKGSPLVQRLDHQRWRICLDEARNPRSDVIQALLRKLAEHDR